LEAIALQKIAVIFDPAHSLPVSANDRLVEYGMIIVERMSQFDVIIDQLGEAPSTSRELIQDEAKAIFKFIYPNTIESAKVIAERIKTEIAE
jgi:hypothetical protein